MRYFGPILLLTIFLSAQSCLLPDSDGDGVPDYQDNCPTMANSDQADSNGNGHGDVCDYCIDNDGDRRGEGDACQGPDCDDSDSSIYPGALEVCDGKDNNCNGSIDEDIIISFSDRIFENVIRKAIEKPIGPILNNNLCKLTELYTYKYKENNDYIKDIKGIEYAKALKKLSIGGNYITDISYLSGLTNLTYLEISGNYKLSDINPLAGLTNLEFLNLRDKGYLDITPIKKLINLQSLDIEGITFSSNDKALTVVAGLTKLTSLNLSHNDFTDLSPLASLINLVSLDFSRNGDESTPAFIPALPNLQELDLSDYSSPIDVPDLSGLKNLTTLYFIGNGARSISGLSGLKNLTILDLRGNAVSNISPLTGLVSLADVDLAQNNIQDINPLLSNSGLGKGDVLGLAENPLDTEALTVEIPALQARGVTVYY